MHVNTLSMYCEMQPHGMSLQSYRAQPLLACLQGSQPSHGMLPHLPFTFMQDLSWKKPARQWEAVLDALASGRSTQPQGQAQAVPTPVQTPEHVARTEKATALQ